MASEEEIRLQRENNDLLKQQNELLKQRMGIDGGLLDNVRETSDVLRDQLKLIKFQYYEKSQLRNISNSINKISLESFQLTKNELSTSKGRNDLEKRLEILKRSILGLNSLDGKIISENARLQANINGTIKDQRIEAQRLTNELKDQLEISEMVSNNFGVKILGGMSEIVKKIPLLSALSGPFEEAQQAASEASLGERDTLIKKRYKELRSEGVTANNALDKAKKEITVKGTSSLTSLKAGFKTLGPIITKALGPIALIAELVKGVIQANKQTVELQKSMSLTRGEAVDFRQNLTNAADVSSDINITASKLLTTFSSLNKQFGFITNFATDTLVTMTKLTNVVGIGAESAGNLAAASSLTGKSFDSNYKDVLGTSYELQRQSGVQMDLRDILEQSGKVTGTVRANLGANPSLIAKAITQAKLFGASLEDVANAGKALLNFESSIEAELQAELLLGRNLNLERARAAALAGDQVTLAQELQKQAGGFEDFTKMNVIQQQALAEAMGMSSDQLANILFQQEIQGKNAKDLRAQGKEELAQKLEAQNLQDKFNATVEKLQEIFTDVATSLMPIIEILGDVLNLVGYLMKFIGPLLKATLSIGSFGILDVIKGDNPFQGVTDAFSIADDAVIPSGYGETIIKKGKDTIALNNNDTVVAGTNLNQNPVTTKVDMSETNQLLKMLVTQNDKKPEISPVGLYQVQ